ncbi:MAG: hypothetical protein GTO17_07790 [Candidatus Aminicenantes bacterium]|nr:hypothetical protein [Candidatus Aminicenantes bacterium]
MAEKKSKYEPPRIITYSADDILEELGPAQACSPFAGVSGAGGDSAEPTAPPNAPGYAPGLPPAFYEPPDKKKKL